MSNTHSIDRLNMSHCFKSKIKKLEFILNSVIVRCAQCTWSVHRMKLYLNLNLTKTNVLQYIAIQFD